ncbi:unnamed protein product [Trifolium pratense]|uniref:Uncharacterized protein n=2 Tax=Trifolium pratense TaxID=57577 RepID=A0ACB0JIX3_TRIPR|nr:unnamed protein product [Trifolium pratense]CAJ2668991.1 unnamed protein product [Trifolium pratense]
MQRKRMARGNEDWSLSSLPNGEGKRARELSEIERNEGQFILFRFCTNKTKLSFYLLSKFCINIIYLLILSNTLNLDNI